MRFRARLLSYLLPAVALPAAAQEPTTPLSVTQVGWAGDRFISGRSVLSLWLSRIPGPSERIGLVIGETDLSALVERSGEMVTYRPRAVRLPAGEHQVTVFVIDSTGGWTEIGRHPLKVLGALGMEQARATPVVDLTSAGMLDRSAGAPAGERTTYQDLASRIGLELVGARAGRGLTARANLQAVSQETQRLRYGLIGSDAPAVDLADYRLGATLGRAELAVGAVTVGANRHLVNAFGSRGLQAGFRFGPAVRLDLGLVSGTNVVGWSNLTGVADANHRIGLAAVGIQLVPSRPGALQLEVTAVDGSVRPQAGFNQGAATDAETSRGVGVTVAASDPKQRIRFAGGFSRSRFANPADPLLFGDSAIVAVQPTARSARFGELALRPIDGLRVAPKVAMTLGITGRHERVDPLYRSIGAPVAADQQNDAVETSMSLGALALQAGLSRTRDNLGAIASILTSRTRATTWSANVPLASLVGAKPSAVWPAFSFGWQRTRQFGEGVPVNGDFQASHVPDQVSINRTAGLSWNIGTASASYRWNRSNQDNRQVGRDRADFRTEVHGISFSAPASRALTLGVEAGTERNKSFELGLTQQVERLGTNLQWQLASRTGLSGAVSQTWSEDPRSDQRLRQMELFAELSQGFNLYRRPDGGTQGRVFVRYGRTRMAMASIAAHDPFRPVLSWTLTAGSSFRAF